MKWKTSMVRGCAGLVAIATLAWAAPVAGGTPSHGPTASGSNSRAAALPAKQSVALVVAAGRIGSLKMGTSVTKAKKKGWIAKDASCGWVAGRKAHLLDGQGNVIFRAYPDKVARGKVLSMHAMGVVTSKGIVTTSLAESPVPGSTLAQVSSAYRKVKRLGTWPDYGTGKEWLVYTTGSAKSGWLDFYFEPETLRVGFVQVRANKVKWGNPSLEC